MPAKKSAKDVGKPRTDSSDFWLRKNWYLSSDIKYRCGSMMLTEGTYYPPNAGNYYNRPSKPSQWIFIFSKLDEVGDPKEKLDSSKKPDMMTELPKGHAFQADKWRDFKRAFARYFMFKESRCQKEVNLFFKLTKNDYEDDKLFEDWDGSQKTQHLKRDDSLMRQSLRRAELMEAAIKDLPAHAMEDDDDFLDNESSVVAGTSKKGNSKKVATPMRRKRAAEPVELVEPGSHIDNEEEEDKGTEPDNKNSAGEDDDQDDQDSTDSVSGSEVNDDADDDDDDDDEGDEEVDTEKDGEEDDENNDEEPKTDKEEPEEAKDNKSGNLAKPGKQLNPKKGNTQSKDSPSNKQANTETKGKLRDGTMKNMQKRTDEKSESEPDPKKAKKTYAEVAASSTGIKAADGRQERRKTVIEVCPEDEEDRAEREREEQVKWQTYRDAQAKLNATIQKRKRELEELTSKRLKKVRANLLFRANEPNADVEPDLIIL